MSEDTTATELANLPQSQLGTVVPDSGADQGAESGGGEQNIGDILSEFENRGLSTENPEPNPGAPAPKPSAPAQPPKPEGQAPDPAAPKPRWDQRTAETAQARSTQLAAVTDPTARNLLTRMSNEGFAHFYPLQLKLQNGELIPKADHERLLTEAKSSAPAAASFVDHERGYMLTPAYEAAATEYQTHTGAVDFWTEQIAAIDAGQPFRVLQKGPNGEPVMSKETYDPKQYPAARAQIEGYRGRAQQQALMLEEKLARFPEQHKAEVQKAAGVFTALSQTMFGNMAPRFAEMAKDVLTKHFPAHMHGNPQTLFTAQMIVAGELAAKHIKSLSAELAKYQKVASAATRGMPPTDDTGGMPERGAPSDDDAIQAIDNIVARRGR